MNDDGTRDGSSSLLRVWTWKLHNQVFLGIVVGVGFGLLSGLVAPTTPAQFVNRFDGALYDFFGSVFMQALRMLIVPLIMSSIITAMAGLHEQANFARMGGKTLLYYATTSLIAVLIGMTLVNAIEPGASAAIGAQEIATSVQDETSEAFSNLEKITSGTAGKTGWDMLNVFKELIPTNIIAAAAEPNMLGLVLFSLLFGIFLNSVDGKHRAVMVSFWEATYTIMVKITFLVLKFLPVGVCFLIANTTAETAMKDDLVDTVVRLLWFALTAVLALLAHALLIMPLILRLFAKVSPKRHFQAMGPALLTAFSTASSSATLPVTMRCVSNRAGVSKSSTGFVLPVGATVNMDGTALYECVAVIFLAQFYGPALGIDLTFADQLVVVAMALLTSIGVAGIPSASLVAIVLILNAVNARIDGEIPKEALAIILIFDRPLDMLRTAVNVWGDSCGAVVVGTSEGETEILREDPDELEARLAKQEPLRN